MLLCSLTAPFYYRLGLTFRALTSEKISKKRGDQTVLWSNRLIGIFCCVRINRQFWVAHIHMLQGRHWLVRCPLCNTPLESSDRQYSLDRCNPAWFCTSSINHRLNWLTRSSDKPSVQIRTCLFLSLSSNSANEPCILLRQRVEHTAHHFRFRISRYSTILCRLSGQWSSSSFP